jgi:hypothetical protein
MPRPATLYEPSDKIRIKNTALAAQEQLFALVGNVAMSIIIGRKMYGMQAGSLVWDYYIVESGEMKKAPGT